MVIDVKKTAVIFKAFCDENRVRILQLLQNGEKCACRLLEEMNITQPTLSHHMKILSDCNLISVRKDGKWSYYSINCKTFSEFKNVISEISCEKNKKSECSCK